MSFPRPISTLVHGSFFCAAHAGLHVATVTAPNTMLTVVAQSLSLAATVVKPHAPLAHAYLSTLGKWTAPECRDRRLRDKLELSLCGESDDPFSIRSLSNANEGNVLNSIIPNPYPVHFNTILPNFKPKPAVPLHFHRTLMTSKYDGCTVPLDWCRPCDNPTYYSNRGSRDEEDGSSFSTLPDELRLFIDRRFSEKIQLESELKFYQHQQNSGDSDGVPSGLVVLVPGAASELHTTYVHSFMRACLRGGYAVVLLNWRGLGGLELNKPYMYHAGFTEDLRTLMHDYLTPSTIAAVLGLGSKAPRVPIALAGVSLGGSMMCKYLGEEGRRGSQGVDSSTSIGRRNPCNDQLDFRFAMALSSPWLLHQGFVHFTASPMCVWVYAQDYLIDLKRRVRQQPLLVESDDEEVRALFQRLLKARTCEEWDEIAVAHYGFPSARDYYSQSECWPHLEHVQVPLLCVTSAGDPVVTDDLTKKDWDRLCRVNSNITHLKLPEGGGHIGFLGSPLDVVRGRPNALEQLALHALDSQMGPKKA